MHRLARGSLVLVAALLLAPSVPGCIGRECADKEDAELPGDSITIELRNDTSSTLFVQAGTVCKWEPFTMTRSGDRQNWNRGPCDFACTAVIDGDCECDRGDCDTLQLVRLEAGASYDVVWDRAVFSANDLSLDCPADGCPTKCMRRKVAGEATYALAAAAGSACDGGDACMCAAGSDACVLSAALSGAASSAATAQLVLPDAVGETVVLSFH